MKTILLLSGLLFFGTMSAYSQTTKEKLEKVKADPKTSERAAKADVYIAKQSTTIADSSSTKTQAPANVSSSTKKKKKKPS
jgi:hypothetical protein